MIGPVPDILGYVSLDGSRVYIIYVLLNTFESLVFRLLIQFLWKRVPPICEDFFQRFLTSFNLLMAFLATFENFFDRKAGATNINLINFNKISLYNIVFYATVSCTIVACFLNALKLAFDFVKWIKKFVTKSIQPFQPESESQLANLNNQARNEELITAKFQAILTPLGLYMVMGGNNFAIVKFLQYFGDVEKFRLVAISSWILLCTSVFVPLLFYFQNRKLRKFVYYHFKNSFIW